MNVQEIREILASLPESFKIQVTNGGVYDLRKHRLTGTLVRHKWYGEAVVLGIRANVKDARRRHAFMLKWVAGGVKHLASRASFKVIEYVS